LLARNYWKVRRETSGHAPRKRR